MQSRTRIWLLWIVVIFVVSFLVGFQPIRGLAPSAAPEVAFDYKLNETLAKSPGEYEAKAAEVKQAIVDGGFNKDDLEVVKLLSGDTVRVKTWALSDEQVAQDEQAVLKALKTKYEKTQALGRVEQEEQEQPAFTLGSSIGVFRPTPKVKLGLDLQGGLHVVLRCLPYASMSFITPADQDQPLYAVPSTEKKDEEKAKGTEDAKDEEKAEEAEKTEEEAAKEEADASEKAGESSDEAAPAADEAKDEKAPEGPSMSKGQLEKGVVAALVRAGLATEQEIEAKAVAPNRLVVRTQAHDEVTAKRQRSVLLNMLQDEYPDYTIEPTDFESVPIESDTADKVKNVIDRRLFQMGEIREPVIQKQGKDKIIVELPGVKDPERVTSILKSTALLEFRLLPQQYENASEGSYDEWRDKRTQEVVSWDRVLAESKGEFHGADLIPNSQVQAGNTPSDWVVTFELKAAKKTEFHEFTRRNVNRLMAIVLDGTCQMAPVIRGAIPGKGIIEGTFTPEEAGDLRLLLNAGALPVPLEIAENRTVSATLGVDSINRSLRAGLVGLALVLIFMIAYYRLPGVLADIALFVYVVLLIGIMAASQAIKGVGGVTLTLPGIAGIILSIGMAVDANVIIFERLKEELWAGKTIRTAVTAGFERAWTAILDANVTTLIIAAVLYFLGTSLIKSFASTLFIGILCSLFTAVTVTRWLVTIVANTKLAQNLALFGVAEGETKT